MSPEDAIVPASESRLETLPVAVPAYDPRLGRWVRLTLIGIAVLLSTVFAIAIWLKPNPAGVGTHRQLGLPPCTFMLLTGGVPCPSCGMTTSFSHLIRGQVLGSLAANPVGTLLGTFCLLLIPYGLICGIWGRRLLIKDYEVFLSRCVIVLLVLLFAGWGLRLGARWWTEGRITQPMPGDPVLKLWGRNSHEGDAQVLDAGGFAADAVLPVRLPDSGPFLPGRDHDGLRPARAAAV
jgi:hypothetical protein